MLTFVVKMLVGFGVKNVGLRHNVSRTPHHEIASTPFLHDYAEYERHPSNTKTT